MSMGAARMKDQEDFDLERFIDMFDQALTSNDERVINALRSLMMMVILTNPEDSQKRAVGPLKRMVEDQNHLFRRLEQIETQIRSLQNEQSFRSIDRQLREKEQYFKWPAQYPTWDMKKVEDDDFLTSALNTINGGHTHTASQTAGAANKTQQIQPQPLTKGNTNGK